MNPKIKKLMKECYVPVSERDGDNEYDMEKFAELIVRECIYQVELTWMNQNGWSRNDNCVQSIKQHFGIAKGE